MDINTIFIDQSLLRGRGVSEEATYSGSTICGLVIDTSSKYSGILKLHYDGTSCNGIKKTGDVVITIVDYPLKKWKHKGCVLKIDFLAYKVVRADGKNLQLDGTEYLSNESGNTWYEMRYLNATDLVQVHTGNDIKVTLDGNSTAVFNINRKMTFNYTNTITSCKIEGLGSSNGVSNLDNWGQNRDGANFTTEIVSPVLWKSNCGSSSPVDGEVHVKVDSKDFDMNCKFGVDSDGNSFSGTGSCAYGWKVSWSYKKKTSTRVFAY